MYVSYVIICMTHMCIYIYIYSIYYPLPSILQFVEIMIASVECIITLHLL